MKNRKWTVRFITEDGSHYANVIGWDVIKIISWVCKENGIDSSQIDYLGSEEVAVVE